MSNYKVNSMLMSIKVFSYHMLDMVGKDTVTKK